MDEEGTEFRLRTLERAFEKDCDERKADNKERKLGDDTRDEKITNIQKLNIKQTFTLDLILGILKVIAGLIAAFIVSNIGMFLIQKYSK